MGLLANILYGYRTLTQGKVPVLTRNTLEFPTGSLTDDPANNRTIYDPLGSGQSPVFGTVTAGALLMGPKFEAAQTTVNTTDGSTVNLLSAAQPVPASGALRVRMTAEAKILSYAHTWVAAWTFAVKWRRDGTSAPVIDAGFVNLLTDESNINEPPFADVGGAPAGTMTFSAAASGTAGVAKLAVASNSGLASGCTVTVSGSSVSAYNGTWAINIPMSDTTHVELRGSTYSSTATGTITVGGSVTPGLVGNSVQVQATGILPPAWISGESVTAGCFRYASGSGNTYVYLGSGTTSASPTGTTTGSDSGLLYEFHAAGQHVNTAWIVTDMETFAS